MAFPLGFALLGLFFRLIFEVEAATCKYNVYVLESGAGLDREYSFANRRGSAWGHRSGEEIRNSISPVWLTVLVTIILAVLYWCVRFFTQVTSASEGDDDAMFEGQSSQPENSGDPIIQICVEDSSGHCKESGANASKPLESLSNDFSDFVEKIFRRLDTRIEGAGHYEVIANYFGFDLFDIRSRLEKSDGGPSRAMIEAIVVRHPELTVEKFARVVEEKARRKDVAHLLRAYDRYVLKESV
ncbi:uncharacterized protein [Acropora muricata]|uniref:uncharacterized protein n=1 Tax=Acropora muricata TaxID=159855 RepID=UPI0034E4BAC8